MSDNYVVQPLTIEPFISISKVDDFGQHPQPIGIDPPLACAPTAARFAQDRSKMALVYDVRIEELPGIGNPLEPPPPAGFKIISYDDNFILFGGDASHPPVLFRRGSPTYLRFTGGIPLPSGSSFFAVGAFSHTEPMLAVVKSDDLTEVEIYQWSGTSFALVDSVPFGFNVSSLEFSPGDEFIVVRSDSEYALIEKATFTVDDTHPGTLLAISPDDSRIIVDDGTSTNLLTMYQRGEVGAWPSLTTIPNSEGTQRSAAFSPDGQVIEVSALNGTSAYSPMFLAEVRGQYRLIKDGLQGFSSLYEIGEAQFSRDGQLMARAIAADGASGQVGIYERSTASMNFFDSVNVTTGLTVGSYIDVTRDGAYLAMGDGNNTEIRKWDGDSFEYLSTILTYGSLVKWSPDGIYLLVAPPNSTSNARIYKRTGDTILYLTDIAVTNVTTESEAHWTADGSYLLVCSGAATATGLQGFTRSGDTFTLSTNIASVPTTAKHSAHISADGNWMVLFHGNTALRFWKKDGSGNFVVTQNPSIPGDATHIYGRRVRLSNDGSHMAVTLSGDTFFKWYKRTGDTFGTISFPVIGVGTEAVEFSPDGTKVAFSTIEAAGNVFVYDISGDSLTFRFQSPTTVSGTATHLSYSADGLKLAACTAASPYAYLFEEVAEAGIPTYELRQTVPLGTALPIVWGFSPSADMLHFDAGITAHHISPADPFGEVAPLPFAKAANATKVSGVFYSDSGKVVWWNDDNAAFNITVTNGRGQQLELNRLDGTFIGLYALGGSTFHEMDFAVHDRGTAISNMVFADSADAFSYFALNEDAPTTLTQGRFIYQTTSFLDLIGQEWDTNMQASFLAFNPQEDHFAATYKRAGGLHDLVLYSFSGATYEQKDIALVAFGPVDYSSCADITVAHGGNPNPFTLYKVIDEQLVLQSFPDMDWEHTGIILNVSFLDCDKMVIITPTEIIIVDKTDGETPTEDDSTERDDPGEGDTIEVDDSTKTVKIPPENGIGSGGGTYGVGTPDGGTWTGGGITALTYIPYVAVNVFYRE